MWMRIAMNSIARPQSFISFSAHAYEVFKRELVSYDTPSVSTHTYRMTCKTQLVRVSCALIRWTDCNQESRVCKLQRPGRNNVLGAVCGSGFISLGRLQTLKSLNRQDGEQLTRSHCRKFSWCIGHISEPHQLSRCASSCRKCRAITNILGLFRQRVR